MHGAMIAPAVLALAIIGCVANAAPAAATDVRYCLALDPTETKAYFSPTFETSAPNEAVERSFARALEAESIPYRIVSCPRSDDRSSAQTARKSAIEYNVRRGKSIRDIAWTPMRLMGRE